MAKGPGRAAELFDDADREAIRRAIAGAEGKTSGEVVPYVVGQCDTYADTVWRAGLFGAYSGVVLAALVYWLGDLWSAPTLAWIVGPALGGGSLGYLLASLWPACKRWLTPAEILDLRVGRRATEAFVEEEIFLTRERTGILLFLALFEHRVTVLADAGINEQVKPEEWQGISDRLAAGVRAGRPAAALVEAIEACGDLLQERRVERRDDDENELGDHLRLRHE